MIDFRWMSAGGVLLDGSGDIAITGDPLESVQSMVASRLKAAINGWKLYQIGAGLEELMGTAIDSELEVAIQRRVMTALSRD